LHDSVKINFCAGADNRRIILQPRAVMGKRYLCLL